ncbi:MAG TPA: aminotransferase class V-fold PLP-dependent enzyme [Brumimicrobium sp.]|nr:aminotransferase class V-fold PLP-dependent enzyme [Brumimicrobium sp.]
MEDPIELKLKNLEDQVKEISPNAEQRKEVFNSYHALSERFLNGLKEKTTYDGSPSNKALYILKDTPEAISETLQTLENDLFQKGINAASGGHLGYIPGGGIYTSAIGDYLAAISNAYSGVNYASPGAVAMEHACLDWLKSVYGFPQSAVGNLTSGGSIANLIALGAARDNKGVLNNISKSVVYMTDQTHHSAEKALRILGLHQMFVRAIPTDQLNRMDMGQLKLQIEKDKAEGLMPSILIGSAGTTDTGAIDPLNEMAEIAKSNHIWFHVDAAYGGFFILTDTAKEKFKGIEKADSIITDPHKGLFLPYGIGAVLVKNAEAVFKSNKITANYMQDSLADEAPLDPADVSPELTKHFRALRMWLPLKTHGIAPFKAALEEKLLLTTYFRNKVEKLGFKTGPTPDLSVTYFWYPFGENENDLNQKLMSLCHKDGRVFLSSTKIEGKFVIRMAILSFRTHKFEIDKALSMLSENLLKIKP